MRGPLAALLSLSLGLAGCTADEQPTLPLLERTITVPPGQFGYVELSLDEGQTVDYDWHASTTADYFAGLGCPGVVPVDREGRDGASAGRFSATMHGCSVLLLWKDQAGPYDVQVALHGDGRIIRYGTDSRSNFNR